MVNKVLFEHEAPFPDDVEQSSLHGVSVYPHPSVDNMDRLQALNLIIDFLIAAATSTVFKKEKRGG